MSRPVTTSKWAGVFDCGTCRRKRLMGDEFSKKALERYRRDGSTLKCKKCVATAEQAERDEAAARKQGNAGNADESSDETRKCSGRCSKVLPKSAYNRNQWSKGENKSRCRACVEQAISEESSQQTKSKDDKIIAARKKVEEAKKTGNAQKIVAAESELAALEAEKVTGLKPVKMSGGGRGRSGGRGRGRFSGSGRGRGGKR